MSLNEYVEKLIRADGGNHVLPPGDPLPVQPQLGDEPEEAPLAEDEVPGDQYARAEYPRFAPNCVNATYHWNNNPDNPCKSCGGVI